MQSVIVLGGGMIGVSAALHLQQRGWSVTLIDRKEPGRETSYGNAGMIQAEAVRPYPMPRDLATLLKMHLGSVAGRIGRDRYQSDPDENHEAGLLEVVAPCADAEHEERDADSVPDGRHMIEQ